MVALIVTELKSAGVILRTPNAKRKSLRAIRKQANLGLF